MAGDTRFNGNGPVTLGSTALADYVEWGLKFDPKLEEVQHLRETTTKRLPVNVGWTGSIKFEYLQLARQLSSIAIGSWVGANVEEWTFEVEAKMEENTGPGDKWKVFNPTVIDYSLKATKWQALSDYKTFTSMLQTQANTPGSTVQATTPFGSGLCVLGPLDFTADGKPAKSEIELRPAAGTFTAVHSLVQMIMTAGTEVLTQGYATALGASFMYTAALGLGSGTCYVSKASFKAPVGKITADVELQGTGEFTFM
jgi:hypothetical protein